MARRRSYTPEFKAKVVREPVEGDDSVGVVASRRQPGANEPIGEEPSSCSTTRTKVFSQERAMRESRRAEEEHREEVDTLNRIIGRSAVERDYLQRSLGERLDSLGL